MDIDIISYMAKKQVQSAVNKNVENETGEALACQQFQEMLFKTLVLSTVG